MRWYIINNHMVLIIFILWYKYANEYFFKSPLWNQQAAAFESVQNFSSSVEQEILCLFILYLADLCGIYTARWSKYYFQKKKASTRTVACKVIDHVYVWLDDVRTVIAEALKL